MRVLKSRQQAEDNGLSSCAKSTGRSCQLAMCTVLCRGELVKQFEDIRFHMWDFGHPNTMHLTYTHTLSSHSERLYHTEKGTSVANFTSALWGHCIL